MSEKQHAVRLLPVKDWPPADAAAWREACSPRPSLLDELCQRSPATDRKYAAGYGAFLWFLGQQNWLDPAEPPAERVTLERLDGFFRWLSSAAVPTTPSSAASRSCAVP